MPSYWIWHNRYVWTNHSCPIQRFNQSEVTVLGSLLNQFSCYCCSFLNTQHLKLRTLSWVLLWTNSDVYCCSFMNTLTWLYFPYFINLERSMTRIHYIILQNTLRFDSATYWSFLTNSCTIRVTLEVLFWTHLFSFISLIQISSILQLLMFWERTNKTLIEY